MSQAQSVWYSGIAAQNDVEKRQVRKDGRGLKFYVGERWFDGRGNALRAIRVRNEHTCLGTFLEAEAWLTEHTSVE